MSPGTRWTDSGSGFQGYITRKNQKALTPPLQNLGRGGEGEGGTEEAHLRPHCGKEEERGNRSDYSFTTLVCQLISSATTRTRYMPALNLERSSSTLDRPALSCVD